MSNKSNRGVNRRTFLTGTAALAAAGVTTSALSDSSNTPQGTNKTPFDYDVIVVGGGFAGATAARELGKQGYRTLVLEARSRLGGRTLTSSFADHSIEFGGAWVHWTQPHVWAEMRRYNLGVKEELIAELDRCLLVDNSDKVKDIPPEKFWVDFQDAFEKFCHDARELFPRPYSPLFNPSVLELDKYSVQDRIQQLSISEDQRTMLNAFMTLYGGGKTNEFGLPGMIKLYACAGWDYEAFFDAESHYRIEGGTIALINALMEDSGAEVRLATPVTAIEQAKQGVRITTDDDTVITAAAAVMTVPVNTYKYIDFQPALSPEKNQFYQQGQLCQGCKLYVHLKQNLGSIFMFCDEKHPFNWVQTHANSDKEGTILSITVARRSTLDVNDDDAIRHAINKIFPDAEMVASAAYDWPNDPFSMGGWPAYRVGQQSQIAHLQKPEGRIFFGGAATANGWHEFIDGAVESGLRVGQEAHAYLQFTITAEA